MNARKFIVLFAIVTLLTMMIGSVSFAKTKLSKKAKEKIVAQVEVWAESGDTKAESGDKEEAKPEVKVESGDEKVEVKSGDEKVEAKSGDEKVEAVSGDEKVETKSGDKEEAKPEVKVESGDEKVEAISGDEKIEAVSGDKEATSGEKIIVVQDVKENDWYKPYVEKVLKNDVMKLDEENKFRPNDEATAEEVLESVSKAEKVSYSVDAKNKDDLLNKKVTREETAYIIYQYAKSAGLGFKGSWMFNLEYKDKDQISKDAYESVAWCSMNKIIIGREDNTLDPKAIATRAEVATMVVRLVENI